jgi:hypothetical protein
MIADPIIYLREKILFDSNNGLKLSPSDKAYHLYNMILQSLLHLIENQVLFTRELDDINAMVGILTDELRIKHKDISSYVLSIIKVKLEEYEAITNQFGMFKVKKNIINFKKYDVFNTIYTIHKYSGVRNNR